MNELDDAVIVEPVINSEIPDTKNNIISGIDPVQEEMEDDNVSLEVIDLENEPKKEEDLEPINSENDEDESIKENESLDENTSTSENIDIKEDTNIEEKKDTQEVIDDQNSDTYENVIIEDNELKEDENKDTTNLENQEENKEIENKDEDKLKLQEESMNILNDYGENFSTKEYLTNPAIGRDEEIKQLIVTLLTPEKSAILVGKPGIGKTAIVEGLGYRIKNGDVPNALKGYTIFKLNTASLTGIMPETNELRIQYIVNHLKNLDHIMIFIDEIHTLIGNSDNSLDFANIFKPIIDRGTIKIIGATTSDEYNRYILKDKAFVRRFQKIDVAEPTRDMVIKIMMGTYPKFEKKMNLKLKYTDFIKETIMAFITDATSEFKRVYETSVRYPDIALTILQQAFSYASFDNRSEVTIRDIRKAIQTTKLIYPDVIKKELVRFNDVFKDVYRMETKQILKDEV